MVQQLSTAEVAAIPYCQWLGLLAAPKRTRQVVTTMGATSHSNRYPQPSRAHRPKVCHEKKTGNGMAMPIAQARKPVGGCRTRNRSRSTSSSSVKIPTVNEMPLATTAAANHTARGRGRLLSWAASAT